MTPSTRFAPLLLLATDATVTTPSGRSARIVALHPIQGEATVQWQDNERGRFKVMNLRPAKEGDA